MARFNSHDELRRFIQGGPAPSNDPSALRRAIADWLASASFDLGGLADGYDGEPVSLVVIAEDAAADFSVYAVPDSEIDDAMRAGLDSIDRSCFEQHFTADLADGQWQGALWLMTQLYAENGDDVEDLLEGPIAEMRDFEMDVDLDRLRQMAGGWLKYAVRSGAGLDRPISRCYTINLAM